MYRFIFAAGRGILNFIYLFHKLAPVRDRISFVSRQSEEPSVDITMLAEELKKQSPETEIVISNRMIGSGMKEKIKYAVHMITKQMHLFATSKVVILDGYCIAACMLKHRKDLKIVQMWHAMGALKKFGYETVGEEEGYSEAMVRGMRMHKNYSVIFVSSEACKPLMAPAFGCDPAIMEAMPLPRTDLLRDPRVKEKNREKIFAAYPQLKKKRVILYAPTFRKERDIQPYVQALIGALDDSASSLIIKPHPLDKEKIHSDRAIIDEQFTSQEWLGAADCVITDYSAFIFEAAAAGVPIFRYTPDGQVYDTRRGFLIDIEQELPVFSSDSAEEIINAVNEERYELAEIRRFADKFIKLEANCTETMADYILHMIRKETFKKEVKHGEFVLNER